MSSGGMEEVMSGYSGRRDFTKHVKDLTHCLLAMPRHALTQHNLSERTWSVLFMFAADFSDRVLKTCAKNILGCKASKFLRHR